MRADDLILVSVDDHLVEPPTMFEGRLPSFANTRSMRVAGGLGTVARIGCSLDCRCLHAYHSQDPDREDQDRHQGFQQNRTSLGVAHRRGFALDGV